MFVCTGIHILNKVFDYATCNNFRRPDECMQITLEEKMKELEKKVSRALDIDYESGALSSLQLLELVDSIERLGLGYRFQDNIRKTLEKIASTNGSNIELGEEEDICLHVASLRFRLHRQHGYNASQGTSKVFFPLFWNKSL